MKTNENFDRNFHIKKNMIIYNFLEKYLDTIFDIITSQNLQNSFAKNFPTD